MSRVQQTINRLKLQHGASDRDRMYCYLWEDLSEERAVSKFGERFVFAEQDPVDECAKRIRDQQGTRKDKFDLNDDIRIVDIWDVSELAERVGRNRRGGHMDDYLRRMIGHVVQSEVHSLSGDKMKIKVDRLLTKLDAPLLDAKLSTMQYKVLDETLRAIDEGKRCIMNNLCARFGKTIGSSAVPVERGYPLVIVASYVKTVFTSFGNDITSFKQFASYEHIDASMEGYERQLEQVLDSGKKAFVYLSMANGSKRQDRIDHLFGLDVEKLLIVDEADYGVHREKQALPLIEKLDERVMTIIMTGTNADRAATYWPIDHVISVTYPELLIEKKNLDKSFASDRIKKFEKDPRRDSLAPELECYQMDVSKPMQDSIDAGEVDFDMYPSWSKFVANPIKGKGFYVRVLQGLIHGMNGYDELNVDYQTESYEQSQKVMMFFFSESVTNKNLNVIDRITRETLKSYEVITLSGETIYNGKRVTNANAEKNVKNAIEKGRPVIIISSRIAQRSFSISEISDLFLMYDQGSNGSTIQKVSRVLTPHDDTKIGRVFSLSFDPNRDDKFDAMIVETAANYAKRNEVKDFKEALRSVLKTIDIFKCTEDGRIPMEIDDYIEKSMERDGISRVLGKIVDIELLSSEHIKALANGDISYLKNNPVGKNIKGKTREKQQRSKGQARTSEFEKDLAKARQMVTTVLENLDMLLIGGAANVYDGLDLLMSDADGMAYIEQLFETDAAIIEILFSQNIIKKEWVDILSAK